MLDEVKDRNTFYHSVFIKKGSLRLSCINCHKLHGHYYRPEMADAMPNTTAKMISV